MYELKSNSPVCGSCSNPVIINIVAGNLKNILFNLISIYYIIVLSSNVNTIIGLYLFIAFIHMSNIK